jgi:hypothetical protein
MNATQFTPWKLAGHATRADYEASYERSRIECAQRTLAAPATQWPAGSSHDVARDIIEDAQWHLAAWVGAKQ